MKEDNNNKERVGTLSKEEWDSIMNYYDDKKYVDEIHKKMDEEKLKKSMNKK